MSLFVDTSVWSLAFRRDRPVATKEARALVHAIETGEMLFATGLVLQELLQGFSGPKARAQILNRFSAIPLIAPDRDDHIEAAALRNRCRQAGIQVGTIDVLFAQLCLRHDLTMLSADDDFKHIARHCALKLWSAAA